MVLPDWAQSAFEKHRPRGVRNDAPDPCRLAWWESCKKRFELRWRDLAADEWQVPKDHKCYVALRRNVILEPVDFVRLCILETALDLAWDKSVGKSPEQVAPAVRELDALNTQIVDAASALAALFRQRAGIQFNHGVEDYDSDLTAPDPFDFWDALELAMDAPHVRDWAYVAHVEAEKFLNIARTQSRPKPRWPDLLDQVAARSQRIAYPGDAGDVAVMASRTNATEWPRQALRLLGTLDDWSGTFPRGFLRQCLTYNQLATLAEVALDAPDNAYSADQMRKLTNRYVERRDQ